MQRYGFAFNKWLIDTEITQKLMIWQANL